MIIPARFKLDISAETTITYAYRTIIAVMTPMIGVYGCEGMSPHLTFILGWMSFILCFGLLQLKPGSYFSVPETIETEGVSRGLGDLQPAMDFLDEYHSHPLFRTEYELLPVKNRLPTILGRAMQRGLMKEYEEPSVKWTFSGLNETPDMIFESTDSIFSSSSMTWRVRHEYGSVRPGRNLLGSISSIL